MAINKRKVLEAARRYANKGARPKALREYGKLLAVDAQDVKLLLEVGDLYRRWGDTEEAIAHYSKVATLYREGGYDSRAIAVLKQIITLDPMRHTVRVALAELYQQIGLSAEAVISLQQVADVYAQEGRDRESLDLLRKMAAVDPANVQARIKVAELLNRAGHSSEAVEEYRLAAAEFKRLEDSESVVQMHEHVLEISPKHVQTLVGIGRELSKLGDAARAESYVLRALEEEIKPEHYELACEVYYQLGDDEKLAEMNRSLAGLYRERGDDERAREVMQRSAGGADLHGADSLTDEADGDAADAGMTSGPEAFGTGPGASAGWEQDEVAAGPEDGAPVSGESDSPDGVFGEGFEIELGDDPEEDFSLDLAGDGGADSFEFGDADLQAPEHDSLSLDVDDFNPEDLDREVGLEASEEPGSGDPGLAPPPEADSGRVEEDLEEAEFYLQQSMAEEAAAVYRRVLEQIPGHPQATARLAEIEAAGGATGAGQGAAPGASSESAFELDAGGGSSADIEIDLDLDLDLERDLAPALDRDLDLDLETDFETEMDLEFDIGTEIRPETSPEPSPGVEGAGEGEAAQDSDLALGDDDIEIEIEIDELGLGSGSEDSADGEDWLGGEPDSIAPAPGTQAANVEEGVAELFADFKQGVSETLDQGDYQTRFDLGIAYREMELLDDAIAEFRYCLDSEDWRLQSLQMIGLSSLDLGRASDAVSHFEQALSAPDLSDTQKAGLCFDLGRAQAAQGETDAAHDSFAQVRGIDPNFAGLKEQVAALSPRTPGTEPADEQFESFDDLMAEFKDD